MLGDALRGLSQALSQKRSPQAAPGATACTARDSEAPNLVDDLDRGPGA